MEALKSGKDKNGIQWSRQVNMQQVLVVQEVYLRGDEHTVSDMFAGMSINSANDSTIALAEFGGGSEESFVNMMNDKAKELGFL